MDVLEQNEGNFHINQPPAAKHLQVINWLQPAGPHDVLCELKHELRAPHQAVVEDYEKSWYL